MKHVKDETSDILHHLARSLRSLWDVTREVCSLSDAEFGAGFPRVYTYFKRFYYDPEDLERARTHCTDLKRDVERITFKFASLLRTDMGRWKEAGEGLRLSLLEDLSYIDQYKKNFENLNQRLNGINALLQQGRDEDALAYQTLRRELSGDLDVLNGYIERMREAEAHVRQLVG